jgi:putative effector of murein hydrolase
VYRESEHNPLVNPVLIAVVALVSTLKLTSVDHLTHFEVAQFVHFLLGPATVALAAPLCQQLQ